MKLGKSGYHTTLKKLSEDGLIGELKQFTLSRVYHMIANARKQSDINDRYINRYDITCWKNNAYKTLTNEQLEEIIKYETISLHIQNFGRKFRFSFYSIKKQSENIGKLLADNLFKNIEIISYLKFNLQMEEVMLLAKLSKECCQFYENGIYVLLVYFVKSSQRLESQGEPIQKIEEMLRYAID